MDDTRVERILRTVESIPAGALATYGDVGAVAGESPRTVGRVLALWGSNVPWWRVCNAKGEIPGHYDAARPLWTEEKIPFDPRSQRLHLASARLELAVLGERAAAALAPLAR